MKCRSKSNSSETWIQHWNSNSGARARSRLRGWPWAQESTSEWELRWMHVQVPLWHVVAKPESSRGWKRRQFFISQVMCQRSLPTERVRPGHRSSQGNVIAKILSFLGNWTKQFYNRSQPPVSMRLQIVNIFSFGGHVGSITAAHVCQEIPEQKTNNTML